jgi:hypothetical protein
MTMIPSWQAFRNKARTYQPGASGKALPGTSFSNTKKTIVRAQMMLIGSMLSPVIQRGDLG